MEDRPNPPAKKRGYKEDNSQSTQEIGAHPRGASELDEIQNVNASPDDPTSKMDQETINLLDDDRVSTGG